MTTQLPGEQQRRTGSSSHCGQKMSGGGKRDKKEEDVAGMVTPTRAPAQPEGTPNHISQPFSDTLALDQDPLPGLREMYVDRTRTLPLAERTGREGNTGALFLQATRQIHNEAIRVTLKPQAALVMGERNMGNGSPLSFSGKKPLEKDLVVPRFATHAFGKLGRASLASHPHPYPYTQQITNLPAEVTGSQQQSCQLAQKTQKREWDSVFQTR